MAGTSPAMTVILRRRLRPQFLAGEPRAFGQRLELRPHDLRMDAAVERALRKAAIGAGDHVLAADDLRQPNDAFGDQFGMRDERVSRLCDE